jgi:hypothetical protein
LRRPPAEIGVAPASLWPSLPFGVSASIDRSATLDAFAPHSPADAKLIRGRSPMPRKAEAKSKAAERPEATRIRRAIAPFKTAKPPFALQSQRVII